MTPMPTVIFWRIFRKFDKIKFFNNVVFLVIFRLPFWVVSGTAIHETYVILGES